MLFRQAEQISQQLFLNDVFNGVIKGFDFNMK